MKTVTDTFNVELTIVYNEEDDPEKEDLMSESDYETLFTHLEEISAGQIGSFDSAKVTRLKHFIMDNDGATED